jgi:SAM-dependent methyltransferase
MTTLAPLDAYRLLAPGYDSSPNPLLALEHRMMTPLLPALRGATVVDVAAGTGRWSNYCRAQGARTVAVDFCSEMLLSAPRPAVLADANQLPLTNGCADVVICAFGLGYASGCLPELARITRARGVVLVSDIHPEAIERGWTRTFRSGDSVIGVEHERYALEDLSASRLRLDCLVEPRLGEQERGVFAQAGKLAAFEEATRHPAIFIARWIKE